MNPEKIQLAVHTADKVVDVADRAVDVIGKGIKVAKPLDAALNAEALLIEETGKRIANTIKTDSEKAQDKLEFINQASSTVREIAPKVADAIEDVLVMAIRKMPELADAAFQHIEQERKTPHGSKVKAGRFADCRIIYFGYKSCIETNEKYGSKPVLIPLTPEYVKVCRYDRKKIKPHKLTTHYYYNIVFHDNSECYIRVSDEHRKNLEICENLNSSDATITLLAPTED